MKPSLSHLFVLALLATSTAISAQGTHVVDLDFDQFANGVFMNSGSTGAANDGVPTSNVTRIGGVIGVGVNLPGGTDEVAAGPSPVLGSQARTVSIWARTTTAAGIVTPMTFGDNGYGPKWDMDIDCNNGGVLELGVGGGRTTGQGPACNDGAWHLLTTVLPAGATTLGGVRVFVDGNLVYTNSGTRTISTGSGPVIVGRSANLPGFQAFIGDVDDLVIWSEGLTDEQVKCLYDVATNASLGYPASVIEQLLEVYRGNLPEFAVGGRLWRPATGLTGPAGLSVIVGNGFELVMDANGNGVHVVQPATVSTFGAGCHGTGGVVPTIGATGTPVIGTSAFSIDVSNANPNTLAAVLLNFSRGDLPIGGGCTVYPQLPAIGVSVGISPAGTATLPMPIVASRSLLGIEIFAQWAVVDTGGAFGPNIAAFSDGLVFEIGDV